MSKRKAHQNVHGTGGSKQYVPVDRKPNARLRKPSTDAGAIVTDRPLYFLIYTGAVMALLFTLKLIFR